MAAYRVILLNFYNKNILKYVFLLMSNQKYLIAATKTKLSDLYKNKLNLSGALTGKFRKVKTQQTIKVQF